MWTSNPLDLLSNSTVNQLGEIVRKDFDSNLSLFLKYYYIFFFDLLKSFSISLNFSTIEFSKGLNDWRVRHKDELGASYKVESLVMETWRGFSCNVTNWWLFLLWFLFFSNVVDDVGCWNCFVMLAGVTNWLKNKIAHQKINKRLVKLYFSH